MKTVLLNLNLSENMKRFVNIVGKYECDFTAKNGKLDAKSVLGLISVDLSRPIDITIHSDDKAVIDRFLEEVKDFTI